MYAKLFSSIYQGTLRGNTKGLVVFTNMLAHADSAGWVDIHPRAISEETGLTIDQVKEAILELSSPDPESRSPEEEGRRIVLIDAHRDWGWRIVNHGKYRAIKNEEDRREQNRIAQKRFREKHSVINSKQPSAQSAQAEAEAEAEEKKDKAQAPFVLPDWIPADAWNGYVDMRKKLRKSMTVRARTLVLKELESLRDAGHDVSRVLDASTKNCWIDVYAPKDKKTGLQAVNAKPKWATDAGFETAWEAENADCYAHNAHQFRNGQRAEASA